MTPVLFFFSNIISFSNQNLSKYEYLLKVSRILQTLYSFQDTEYGATCFFFFLQILIFIFIWSFRIVVIRLTLLKETKKNDDDHPSVFRFVWPLLLYYFSIDRTEIGLMIYNGVQLSLKHNGFRLFSLILICLSLIYAQSLMKKFYLIKKSFSFTKFVQYLIIYFLKFCLFCFYIFFFLFSLNNKKKFNELCFLRSKKDSAVYN